MDISVVFDSNTLFVRTHRDYATLNFFHSVERAMADIIDNSLDANITLCVPELVANELIRQQYESYDKKIRELKTMRFPMFEVVERAGYREYLESLFQEKVEEINRKRNIKFATLPYPQEESVLNKTIIRAIDKAPPFEGKRKQSDKGFKDAMIWESILEYKAQNRNQVMVLVSKDSMFNDKGKKDRLLIEYTTAFGEDLVVTGREDLLVTLGRLSGTPVVEGLNPVFERFRECFLRFDPMRLFHDISLRDPVTEDDFPISKATVLDMIPLGEPRNLDDENILYFIVEIKIKLECQGYLSEPVLWRTYDPEFEIAYYTREDAFCIDYWEPPVDDYEREIIRLECNEDDLLSV